MKRLRGRSGVIVVVAVGLLAFQAAPASAATVGTAYLSGPPSSGSFSMSGLFVGVIDTSPATCDVFFAGSLNTTLVVGTGSGSMSCNGAFVTGGAVSIDCSVIYNQVGINLLVSGTCTGTATGALTMTCTMAPVTTTYVWKCDAAVL